MFVHFVTRGGEFKRIRDEKGVINLRFEIKKLVAYKTCVVKRGPINVIIFLFMFCIVKGCFSNRSVINYIALAAVRVGVILGSLIQSTSRNPSLRIELFNVVILGFALTETLI